MIDIDNDEQILDRFRDWLRTTRLEAAEVGESSNGEPESPAEARRIGLDRLIEEFTALRHELKLQTRGARSLEERVESSLATLAAASSLFQSVAAQAISAGSESTAKNLALMIAEIQESLIRAYDQWNKNVERLIGSSASERSTALESLYRKQPLLRRLLIKSYHAIIIKRIEEDEETARGERRSLTAALLSGYDLILRRMNRNMTDLGLNRFPTVGRIVDPDRMVVIEVVESDDRHGEVIEEIRPGYEWKGVLLRPAEVRANRPRINRDRIVTSAEDGDRTPCDAQEISTD